MNETAYPLQEQPVKAGEKEIGSRSKVVLWLTFLMIPLIIGVAWGAYFDDSVYATFRHARDLAPGNWAKGQTLLDSPFYTLMLALLAGLGIPLSQASLIGGALGWGAIAIALYVTGQAMGRSTVAVVSAVLVAFNPMVISTLGTEIPWTVALAWIAIAASVKKRWGIHNVALVLMLCVRLDLSTLTLAMLLLAVQWVERRRIPLWLYAVLTVVAIAWVFVITQQIAAPILQADLDLSEWGRAVSQLLDESELYWLFLPLLVCGVIELLGTSRKISGIGLLWGAWGVASVSSGSLTAMAMMVTMGLFLTGVGVHWIAQWIVEHYLSHLDRLTLTVSVALAAGAFLGLAQASSLYQRYRFRPVVHQALEQQAAEWLSVYSESTAVVLGSEQIGYLADRSVLAWSEEGSELVFLPDFLAGNSPDYCVSSKSLAWDRLMRTGWFQDEYVPLAVFESPYDAASPITVWGRRFRAFDWAEQAAHPLSVRLPDGAYWVGYKYQPERFRPGDAIHVTLFSQWTQPLSFRGSFRPVVRLVSPNDGTSWAQQWAVAARNVLTDSWRTGLVVAEELVLTPPDDIPVGAYRLDVSAASHSSEIFLSIYLDDGTVPFKSATLGYVVVPWQGSLDGMRPVNADFGNQITLLGLKTVDSVSPGTEFDVKLYWEAQRPPEDDYFVFVHLLDANGQPIAQHDGPPMGGRYPPSAWLPGDVVPDVHRIVLGSDLPLGVYRLQVGMYRWPSLERLPVWNEQGIEQPDRVIVLQSVRVK
ncbi:MAG: hypothetical protein GY832_21860 [Chloroflexi bacterium]|nr:hypothetical protein [Chloroflexota bacterium]